MIADFVTAAQRRLLTAVEAGDEGWWGTWAHMVFNVPISNPTITCPREVARIEKIRQWHRPVPVQNQFYEYIQFGCGRNTSFPGWGCLCDGGIHDANLLSRNNAATFIDLSPAPQNLYIFPANAADAGASILVQGTDNNGNVLTSEDSNGNTIQGVSVSLAFPLTIVPVQLNSITGIQKPVTQGSVTFSQSDPVSMVQVQLLTMEAGEQVASYRRYAFSRLLPNGPSLTPGTIQVQAIVKLELIPAVVDSDYLLIQNLEALIEEVQSIRYSKMDTSEAKQMSIAHHTQAVRLLQGELVHYLGKELPAFAFKPFGNDPLSRVNIGMI